MEVTKFCLDFGQALQSKIAMILIAARAGVYWAGGTFGT